MVRASGPYSLGCGEESLCSFWGPASGWAGIDSSSASAGFGLGGASLVWAWCRSCDLRASLDPGGGGGGGAGSGVEDNGLYKVNA